MQCDPAFTFKITYWDYFQINDDKRKRKNSRKINGINKLIMRGSEKRFRDNNDFHQY